MAQALRAGVIVVVAAASHVCLPLQFDHRKQFDCLKREMFNTFC